MAGWPDPADPEPNETPPSDSPDERPTEPDPEAQQAPGAGQEDPDSRPAPMEARAGTDEIVMDGPGYAREPVGNDNIREGRVGGVMGGPHQQGGQGQGG